MKLDYYVKLHNDNPCYFSFILMYFATLSYSMANATLLLCSLLSYSMANATLLPCSSVCMGGVDSAPRLESLYISAGSWIASM